MKKILSILLSALLLLSVTPATAFAAETDAAEAVAAPADATVGDDGGSVGGVTWYYENATGELTLGGTGALPDYASGYETPWAAYRQLIDTITIGGSVTRIGSYAFEGCVALDSVRFLTPLESIGDHAFLNCGLQSVTLTYQPCDLEIGDYAFAYFDDNGEITGCVDGFTIYSDTTAGYLYTGDKAFMSFAFTANEFFNETDNCHWSFDTTTGTLTVTPKGNGSCAMDLPQFWVRDMALNHFVTKLVIGEGLTTVSDGAFFGCSLLEEVELPNTLNEIEGLAFRLCTSLTTVRFPASLREIGLAAFSRCDALSSVSLNKGLQTVGERAFCDTALTSVIIPASVTQIGSNAFGYTDYNSPVPEQLTPVSDFVIYGESGSAAETYATDNSLTFISTSGTTGDCLWAFDPDTGTLTISGEGAMADYANPEDIRGTFFDPWREFRKETTKIVIEDGVTHVGKGSFIFFSYVKELYIGNTVQTIGRNAFRSLVDITEVALPDSLEKVGPYAFAHEWELESVTFGSNLKRIEANAFSYCHDLTGIILPDSVEYIGFEAFMACKSLSSIVIGECSAMIDTSAFEYCDFTKVYIPESITRIANQAFGYTATAGQGPAKIEGFTIYGVAGSAAETYANENEFPFVAASGETGGCSWKFEPNTATLTVSGEGETASYVNTTYRPWHHLELEIVHIVIRDGVTCIGTYSFTDCRNTESISLGSTVQTIGDSAFSQCGDGHDVGLLTEITIPDSVEIIGKSAFRSDQYLQHITFGSGIKSIGDEAFLHTAVTDLTLPDSVETIGRKAFFLCDYLTSVALNEGLTSVGEAAFLGCNSLTEIYIPDSVTAIGTQAFGYEKQDINDEYVYTPKQGFTIYGNSGTAAETYANANGFTFVALNGATGDCQWKFNRNTGRLTIYNGTATADYTASVMAPWHGLNDRITAVVVRSGVTTIGDYCFYDLPCLTAVSLPDAVTAIGENAFRYCERLASLKLPSALSDIGLYAFGGTALTSVTIPDGVTTISDSAFANCESLTAVTLPEGLTVIEAGAFVGCPLTYLDLPFTLQTIGATAFLGAQISSVTIPPSVTAMGQYAVGYDVDENHATLKRTGFTIRGMADSAAETYANTYGFPFVAAFATGVTGAVKWAVDIPGAELIIYGSGAMGDYYGQAPAWMYVDLGTDSEGYPRQITRLTIRDGVTYIGDSAFTRLSGLKFVDIGSSLTSCGTREPFYGLSKLYSVNIAEGVTTIPAHLFENCQGHDEEGCFVTLPSTLTSIGFRAFYNFENLRSLYGLHNAVSLTAIGEYACCNCKRLGGIAIPDTVTEIGSYAFYGCEELAYAAMSANVQTIGAGAFAGCESLGSVTLPETLISLGSEAFAGCTSLSAVNIPANVTVDGVYGPFSYCDSLQNITFTTGRTEIPDYLFHRCTGIRQLTLPDTVTTIGRNAFAECSGMTAVTLPDGLEEIGCYVFQNCSSLQSLEIPDGVTTLYNTTFAGCSALETIDLPDTMTTIESNVFENCASLQAFEAPAGVTYIHNSTFKNCTSLSGVTLHGGVTAIGGYAFEGCTALQTLTIPEGVSRLNAYAFRNCTALETVSLPASVCGGDGSAGCAFDGCSALRTVHFANGSTRIPSELFRGTGVTEISFPDTVTVIENAAFADCADLASVTLPPSLQKLDTSAFSGCPITEITIPKTLTNAGSFAQYGPFSGCHQLTTVHFEEGATRIAASLFTSCDGLQEVEIPDTVTAVGSNAFRATSLTGVTIPRSVTSIGAEAFGYDDQGFSSVKVEGFTIRGDAGSAAYDYAVANGFDFIPTNIGDVDLDGVVTVTDVTELQKCLADLSDFNDAKLLVADTNADGAVDIADATVIQMYIAAMIDHFGA